MELVAVEDKYQIVIPRDIREAAHIEIGDLLEAAVVDGRITFTRQAPLDRHLAEGLEDFKLGRSHGPYANAAEAIAALNARVGRGDTERTR